MVGGARMVAMAAGALRVAVARAVAISTEQTVAVVRLLVAMTARLAVVRLLVAVRVCALRQRSSSLGFTQRSAVCW